jgi:HAD superfamily hydrolase (TIGR01484 family)
MGRPISVATRHRLSANGWEPNLAEYYRMAGLELAADAHFDEACREDVYQIMVGCREPEHTAILRGAEGAGITFSWDRAADVIPAGGSKGAAILKILDHFRLNPDQAMAFGDGVNDIEMLQTVGTGVAMGNADPRVKAIAKDQCLPVSRDGIYHYCLEHGLI